MKCNKYLPAIRDLRTKKATRGERVIASLFPNRGTGFPGGWSNDRIEQVMHFKQWTYVAIDAICCKTASVTPNLAYVMDGPIKGVTRKACQRGLLNYLGNGFGGSGTIEKGMRRDYTQAWEPDQLAANGGGESWLTVGEYRSKALSVVKPHEDLAPLESNHPLRRLLDNPNPVDTFFDLMYELTMFGELCGVDYLWAVPNDFGVPCELWCLPSHWVWPRVGGGKLERRQWVDHSGIRDGHKYIDPTLAHSDEMIHYYEIRPWGGMGSAGVLRIPPNEIITTRWKSPINKIDGYSKLGAISRWIDSEESISNSRWAQFMNQARPEFWLELGQGYEDPDDDRIARIEAKFAAKIQGEFNYGKPVITPPGAKITPLSFSPTEMSYYQCCSYDTECLTDSGWVTYDRIDNNTKIACYDHKTGQLRYHNPSRIIVSKYTGNMHHWKSDGVDILVTPEHRMLVKVHNKAGQPLTHSEDKWRIERMQNLSPDYHYQIKITAPIDTEDPGDVEIPMYKKYARGEPAIIGTYKISPGDWARFLGWFVSEGCLSKLDDKGYEGGHRRRHRVSAASQKISSPHVPTIEDALKSVPPYEWTKNICGGKDNRGCYQWYATDRGLYLHLKEHCGATAREKRLPKYIMSWPSYLLQLLLDAAISGDGREFEKNAFGNVSRHYRTTSSQLAEDMAEIGVKCGFRASIQNSSHPYKGEKVPYYTVHLSDRVHANVHSEHQKIIEYDNYIWCVTVPTGLFVVRRNGKAHITGNSMEQIRDMILSTFRVPPAIVGIDRAMTYGSVLASLATFATHAINPRLAMRGQSLSKALASRWDEKDRKVRLFWDNVVPMDPQQVNSDIAEDRLQYAIYPNEVRALRGRTPYQNGGNNPIVLGPAGPMPLPINVLEPMDNLGALVGQFTQQSMSGIPGADSGQEGGDLLGSEESLAGTDADLGGGVSTNPEGDAPDMEPGIDEPGRKPEKSLTFEINKAGACKPGERSDQTGCIPSTEDSGKRGMKRGGPNDEAEGERSNSPKTNIARQIVANVGSLTWDKLKKLTVAAGDLEEATKLWLKDKTDVGIQMLPKPLGSLVRGSLLLSRLGTKTAFATYRAGQAMAEKVAKSRGATDEEAAKLRHVLSVIDVASFKLTAIGLGAVGLGSATVPASMIPLGSSAYLAYSGATAALKMQNLRKAKDAVKSIIKKNPPLPPAIKSLESKVDIGTDSEPGQIDAPSMAGSDEIVSTLLAKLRDNQDDYYLALVYAALDKTGDLHEAIRVADDALRIGDGTDVTNSPNTEVVEEAVNGVKEGEVVNSTNGSSNGTKKPAPKPGPVNRLKKSVRE